MKKLTNLNDEFTSKYFNDITAKALADPLTSLSKDIKQVFFGDYKIAIGQMEVWDGNQISKFLLENLSHELQGFQNLSWFVTIASISEGKNYLICRDNKLKEILTTALCAQWIGDLSVLPKLLLRKEIIRDIQKILSLK